MCQGFGADPRGQVADPAGHPDPGVCGRHHVPGGSLQELQESPGAGAQRVPHGVCVHPRPPEEPVHASHRACKPAASAWAQYTRLEQHEYR